MLALVVLGALAPAASAQSAGDVTLSFTASGTSSAPYPGTFTEQGTVTLGPTTGPFPGNQLPLVDFEATFEIISGDTVITGTKSGSDLSSIGNVCLDDAPDAGDRQVVINGNVRYQATITSPTGTFTDEGDAGVSMSDLTIGGTFISDNFTERLDSDDPFGPFALAEFLTASGEGLEITGSCTTPSEQELPTDPEECKVLDFELFDEFKNQGDCIAFIRTKGKNEPGQNIPGLP